MNTLEYLNNSLYGWRPSPRLYWTVAGLLLVLGAALYPWRAERHGRRQLRVAALPAAVANYLVALAYPAGESAIESGWRRVAGRVVVAGAVLGMGVLAGI